MKRKIKTVKRRRLEGKTDYNARVKLLKSGTPRVVLRRSNRYVTGQYVESKEAKDSVVVSIVSKELLKYGWPENARYHTGLSTGKRCGFRGSRRGVCPEPQE